MVAFTYGVCSNLGGFPKADDGGGGGAMLASAKKFDQKQKLKQKLIN